MDSTIPRLWLADPQIRREDLYTFQDEAHRWFSGELKRSAFCELAARFGCIPSGESDTLLYHVPVPGGYLNAQLAQYLEDAVREYEIPRITLTQAPGILLHELQIQPLCELLDKAFDLGLLPGTKDTPGGGQEAAEDAKTGDGGTITHPRVREQSKQGLYKVYYHPIGGYADPGEFCRILDAVRETDGAQLALSCAQEMWICSLTSDEAEQILNLTGASGQTAFERSVLALIDAVDEEEPDAKVMLEDSIRAVYRAQIPEDALPRLLITDDADRALYEAGLVQEDPEDVWPAGSLLVVQEKEDDEPFCSIRLMPETGSSKKADEILWIGNEQLPLLFTALGKAVAGSGMDYYQWYAQDPEQLLQFARNGAFGQEHEG